MKKQFVFLLILFFSQIGHAGDSKTFFRADYGLGQFKSDKLDALNANLSGSTYGFEFGPRIRYVEIGVFYRKFDFKKEITHDSVANTILHEGNAFGLDLNIFLNSHLSLKVGYAVNSYKQKFATTMSAASETAANSIYGIESDGKYSNVFYGANFDFFGTKSWDFYASVIQFPMGDGKNTLSTQLGIRYFWNKSLSDFIGD